MRRPVKWHRTSETDLAPRTASECRVGDLRQQESTACGPRPSGIMEV